MKPPARPPAATTVSRSRARRALWLALGCAALALGAIGAFLPVLPTTPFVLLAAACFARGSQRFHRWLLDHRWFGPIVREWEAHRSIPRRAKRLAIAMMWTSMAVSLWVFRERPAAQLALAVLAIGLTVYLWRIPTREGD